MKPTICRDKNGRGSVEYPYEIQILGQGTRSAPLADGLEYRWVQIIIPKIHKS